MSATPRKNALGWPLKPDCCCPVSVAFSLGSGYGFESSTSPMYDHYLRHLLGNTPITIAMWVWSITEPDAYPTLLAEQSDGFANDRYPWAIDVVPDGAVTFKVGVGTGPAYSVRAAISANPCPNEWAHVECSYDGQIQRIYINGVKQAEQDHLSVSNIRPTKTVLFKVGTAMWTNIDDVHISNIVRHTGASFTVPNFEVADSNTIALWDFQNGWGQQEILDMGGKDFHLYRKDGGGNPSGVPFQQLQFRYRSLLTAS